MTFLFCILLINYFCLGCPKLVSIYLTIYKLVFSFDCNKISTPSEEYLLPFLKHIIRIFTMYIFDNLSSIKGKPGSWMNFLLCP